MYILYIMNIQVFTDMILLCNKCQILKIEQ